MSYCIVNCTAKNKKEAINIAKHLVQEKLIACCNIIPSVISIYEWKNDLQKDEEVLMVMKTETELYNRLEERIKKLHSYEVPEIICIPIINGSSKYLEWIDEQTLNF